jgi:hypothetical protein
LPGFPQADAAVAQAGTAARAQVPVPYLTHRLDGCGGGGRRPAGCRRRGSNGTITDLGSNFSPAAVNDSGVIVGGQFVYSDGTLQNLNTLIPAGSGSQIQSATSINDNGQISPTPTAPPPARPTPCC